MGVCTAQGMRGMGECPDSAGEHLLAGLRDGGAGLGGEHRGDDSGGGVAIVDALPPPVVHDLLQPLAHLHNTSRMPA